MSSTARPKCALSCFLPSLQSLCLSSYVVILRDLSHYLLLIIILFDLNYTKLLLLLKTLQIKVMIDDCLWGRGILTMGTIVSSFRWIRDREILNDGLGIRCWPTHLRGRSVWHVIQILVVQRTFLVLMSCRMHTSKVILFWPSNSLLWEIWLKFCTFLQRQFWRNSQTRWLKMMMKSRELHISDWWSGWEILSSHSNKAIDTSTSPWAT